MLFSLALGRYPIPWALFLPKYEAQAALEALIYKAK